MRDRYLLTPADIKAQDDAQAERDFWWLTRIFCAVLALFAGVFVWALWSVR